MSRGKGWRPNPRTHRRTLFGACRWTVGAWSAVTTPAAVSLASFAPEVFDQGQTGSCTGHGTATGLATTFAAGGAPLPWVPSPAEIYRNGRAIDRVRRPDGSLAPLADEGAEPNQVIRAIQALGIRSMRARPSDGRYSDADPATINAEPMLDDLELERLVVPVGERAIAGVGDGAILDQVVDGLRRALAGGFAVGLGVYVDTAFENWDPQTGPQGACDPNDPEGGGHWLCVIGYHTEPTGSTTFQIRNSWSRAWGLAGDIEVTPAFIGQCQDLTVFVPELEKAVG